MCSAGGLRGGVPTRSRRTSIGRLFEQYPRLRECRRGFFDFGAGLSIFGPYRAHGPPATNEARSASAGRALGPVVHLADGSRAIGTSGCLLPGSPERLSELVEALERVAVNTAEVDRVR